MIRTEKVVLKIDTTGYVAALEKAAAAAERLHLALHRSSVAITHRPLKKSRLHRARCRLCSPMANPPPLTIDGHAYARRRKNRQRRNR